MNSQRLLEELLQILESAKIDVRKEAFGAGGGGLCIVNDKPIVFLDTKNSALENAQICAHAITLHVNIENIYIRPQTRQFIESARPQRS